MGYQTDREFSIDGSTVKKTVRSAGATTRFNAFGRMEFSAGTTSNASADEIIDWKKQPDYFLYCKLFNRNPDSAAYAHLGGSSHTTVDSGGDG